MSDRRADNALIASVGREQRQRSGPGASFGAPVETTENLWPTLRRLFEILGRQAILLVVVLVLTIGTVVLQAFAPRMLGHATDLIIQGAQAGDVDFGALNRQLLEVLAVYIISALLIAAQAWLLAGVVQRSMFELRQSVERKIHRLPLSYIDDQQRGDLLSRVTNDIDNLAQSLQQSVSNIVRNVLVLVATAVMMFVVSPVLAVVGLLTVPLALYLIKTIGTRARPKYLGQWRYTGLVNSQAEEVFTGHTIVKSFGRQHEAEQRFNLDNEKLYESSFEAQFTSSLIQPSTIFVGNLQFVLIAVVGGLRVASGAISIGDMQAMIQYTRTFAQPLTMLASMATTLQSGIASLERVLELLDAPEISEEAAPSSDGFGAAANPIRGRIMFEHVNFSYSPDQPLITDLNVVAEPGQTIAIVGPTGAGKTTIVNLLMRFYELDSGRITIDSRDIAAMPRAELRAKIGMVLQDTWLFGGTIRDNLLYANPNATEDELMEAARVTFVDRFVSSLPDGYETIINDEGDNISIGEKQLITIARAFLTDPSILILDEATSSVDTRTEVLIQEAMNQLRTNRTSFVIAHRLSTIRGADNILVMTDGRIVEQGNHDQLIATEGAYHALYMAQFAGQSI